MQTKTLFPVCVLGVTNDITGEITDSALALLRGAHCIAAPQGLLSHLQTALNSNAKTDTRPDTEYLVLDAHLLQSVDIMVQRRLEGKRVVVLVYGDPLYFGMGTTLVRRLGTEAVHIIPATSIVQGLCAHLGMAWHDVRHVTLHGRRTPAHWLPLFHGVLANKAVCLLTDAHASPARIAQELLERGAAERTVHIFSQWGSPAQEHHSASLAHCAAHLQQCPQPYTLLILPSTTHTLPFLGIDASELVCENSLMTKLPVRATALSLLRLAPHHTLWDVGSGSGAVALEAAALLHEGQCVAIEQNASRVAHIHENRRRVGALNVHICHESVPNGLDALPQPDRIFVGGSLNCAPQQQQGTTKADAILDALCHHLAPAGHMVISCVLLGTLYRVQNFFEEKGWTVDITHVQVTQSAALGGDNRLVPHNPVFLIRTQKPRA